MRGSTLVEAVVAIALLVAIMLCVMNIFPASLWAVHRTEQRSQADNLAQSLVEDARGADFDTLTVAPPTAPSPVDIKGVRFLVTREIFSPKAGDPSLKGIRVWVRWSDGDVKHEVCRELQVAKL